MANSEFEKNLTEEQKMKLAALRAALIEGEKSGMLRSFDFEKFLKRQLREHSKRTSDAHST